MKRKYIVESHNSFCAEASAVHQFLTDAGIKNDFFGCTEMIIKGKKFKREISYPPQLIDPETKAHICFFDVKELVSGHCSKPWTFEISFSKKELKKFRAYFNILEVKPHKDDVEACKKLYIQECLDKKPKEDEIYINTLINLHVKKIKDINNMPALSENIRKYFGMSFDEWYNNL